MAAKAYPVYVALSTISGSIYDAGCTNEGCVANALDRCSHVTSVLWFLLQHLREFGDKGKVVCIFYAFVQPSSFDFTLDKC